MTKTKLQKTSDKQYPYVYFDKLLIEIGFRWKKGEPLDIDYDLENKRIVVTQTNKRKGIMIATKSELEKLRNDPLVQMYANAPDEIYQLAKNTNPMLRKAIEWAKAIVTSNDIQ